MPLDRFRHHGLITVQDVTKVASPGQAYMAVRLAILSPFDEVEVKVVRGTQPCNQPVLAKYYGADGQRCQGMTLLPLTSIVCPVM